MKIVFPLLLCTLLCVLSPLQAQPKEGKKSTHLLGLEIGMSKEDALATLQKAGLSVAWKSPDGLEVTLDGSIAGVHAKGIQTKYNAAGQLIYFRAEFDQTDEPKGKSLIEKVIAAIRRHYGNSQTLQWRPADGTVVSAIYDFETAEMEFVIEKP